MLGLTKIVYIPDDFEMKIVQLFAEGYTRKEMAIEFGIPYHTLRKRVEQLKLNLGVGTVNEMMYLFGLLHPTAFTTKKITIKTNKQ